MRRSKAAPGGASKGSDPVLAVDQFYAGGEETQDFEFGLRQGAHVFVPDSEPKEKVVTTPEKGMEFMARARDHTPRILLELQAHAGE
jgi:hypothetical protein